MAANSESPEVEAPARQHETEELLPKPGAVSVVWKFFGFKKDDILQTTIICKCCRAKVVTVVLPPAATTLERCLHCVVNVDFLQNMFWNMF